jgi:hypothetical protein
MSAPPAGFGRVAQTDERVARGRERVAQMDDSEQAGGDSLERRYATEAHANGPWVETHGYNRFSLREMGGL